VELSSCGLYSDRHLIRTEIIPVRRSDNASEFNMSMSQLVSELLLIYQSAQCISSLQTEEQGDSNNQGNFLATQILLLQLSNCYFI